MSATEDKDSVNDGGSSASDLEAVRESLGLNKKQAAERLGVSYSGYRDWEAGRTTPNRGYERVIRHLKSGDTLAATNATGDPIYDSPASAGDGSMEIHEDPVGYMPPSRSLSSAGRDVYWVPVRGDSMGEKYRKHTLVPVARFEETLQDISEDDVYHIRLEGAVQIKRLQRLAGQRVRIISDNDSYPNETVQLDEGVDFEVLGRVLV